jgi:hypothetical protein
MERAQHVTASGTSYKTSSRRASRLPSRKWRYLPPTELADFMLQKQRASVEHHQIGAIRKGEYNRKGEYKDSRW